MIKVRKTKGEELNKVKPRRNKAVTLPSTAASSSVPARASKRKVVKIEDDDDGDSIGSGSSRKKARIMADEGLLSRSDAAELIGRVAMEVEAVQDSLNRVRELLGDFAGQANGKKRVTIKSRV